MSVLFCDSDCELWYTRAKELGVKVIEMPYTLDGEECLYDLGEKTDLKAFFDKALPGYDGDRFYTSHMKKVVTWYNLLKQYASLDFEEHAGSEEEEKEEDK